MKDEVETPILAASAGSGLANALASVGRDLQREAYVMQSHGWLQKPRLIQDDTWWIGELTAFLQALFRTLLRSQRKGAKSGDQFFSASHFIHVRPMFEVAWIAFPCRPFGTSTGCRRSRSSGIMS